MAHDEQYDYDLDDITTEEHELADMMGHPCPTCRGTGGIDVYHDPVTNSWHGDRCPECLGSCTYLYSDYDRILAPGTRSPEPTDPWAEPSPSSDETTTGDAEEVAKVDPDDKVAVVVYEETTTTYEVTNRWLAEHGLSDLDDALAEMDTDDVNKLLSDADAAQEHGIDHTDYQVTERTIQVLQSDQA